MVVLRVREKAAFVVKAIMAAELSKAQYTNKL